MQRRVAGTTVAQKGAQACETGVKAGQKEGNPNASMVFR